MAVGSPNHSLRHNRNERRSGVQALGIRTRQEITMPSTSGCLDLLAGQRQTRTFTDEPVSDADLRAVLEVMRWTGSAGNSQPWRFIVIRDPATRKALSESVDSMSWIAKAPLVLVVVVEDGKSSTRLHDLGRVDERILLAAQALGLGAGIVSFWNAEAKAHGRAVSTSRTAGPSSARSVSVTRPKNPPPRPKTAAASRWTSW